MRPYLFAIASAIVLFLGCSPVMVQAQALTGSVGVATGFADSQIFNDDFSHTPQFKFEASYDISKHIYAFGYLYTGFEKPLRDESSEYGLEIGSKWDLSDHIKASLAVGRYSNYGGLGFGQGDWYAKAALNYDRLTVSASVLQGVSDTVLVNVSYELPVTKKLTLTPSVVYYTADGRLNPAVLASYKLTDKLSFGVSVVLPEDGVTKKWKPGAAVSLTASF